MNKDKVINVLALVLFTSLTGVFTYLAVDTTLTMGFGFWTVFALVAASGCAMCGYMFSTDDTVWEAK